VVQRSIILACFATTALVGCQQKAEPVAAPAPKDSSVIIGTYRLKATPEESAEAGGLEKLPTLVIKPDHFRIVIEGQESSGLWKYEDGILTLSDKETGENTRFRADSTGTELTEDAEDPIIFAKFGVEQSKAKPD
jgi:uncharacterized lipoprotein NlpE involved in copper resistance